jgi:hypothetical protein
MDYDERETKVLKAFEVEDKREAAYKFIVRQVYGFNHIEKNETDNLCAFDFLIQGLNKNLKIEIKVDAYPKVTHNLFIEVQSYYGKPSGIMTSKADYVLYITNTNLLYSFPLSELKELIKDKPLINSCEGCKGILISEFEVERYCVGSLHLKPNGVIDSISIKPDRDLFF